MCRLPTSARTGSNTDNGGEAAFSLDERLHAQRCADVAVRLNCLNLFTKKLTCARVVPLISARLSRCAAPARNRLGAAPRPTLPGRPAVERLVDEREVQDGEPAGESRMHGRGAQDIGGESADELMTCGSSGVDGFRLDVASRCEAEHEDGRGPIMAEDGARHPDRPSPIDPGAQRRAPFAHRSRGPQRSPPPSVGKGLGTDAHGA
jgi:hypothetical protein